ncbi:MAG TPA: MlaD family protein [Acidobacteriaceae bacterium]|nr:MlaD family protein [Acidobacteriaceae bacterium]
MRWSQLKVGVLVIVALCALIALIFLMTGSTGGFWSGHLQLRSYFENSAGLKVGAPVNLEGVTIGNVSGIHIVPSREPTPVEVVMQVNRKYAQGIRTDSKTSLTTVGVLGDTVVNIESKFSKGSEVQKDGELPTTETPDIQDVIQASQGTIEQLDTILAKVNTLADALTSGKGSIGLLINDPTLYQKAVLTLNQLQSLVDSISNGKGSIGKLVNDDTLYNRANDAVGKLQSITTDLDNGKGTIGKLLKDPTLYDNLKDSTRQLNEMLTTINSGKGSIGMLYKDPAFARKLTDTVDKLDSVLTQVDSGQGTLGAMLKDRTLYDHIDKLTTDSSDLVIAIRKDPKKYLTFHVKIF